MTSVKRVRKHYDFVVVGDLVTMDSRNQFLMNIVCQ